MNISQPIILDIESLKIEEEKSKRKTKTKTKTKKITTNEKPKKTKNKQPMEIKDFHHPRKVRTCQGWETPFCGGFFRKLN
jgi:hypothetical protein